MAFSYGYLLTRRKVPQPAAESLLQIAEKATDLPAEIRIALGFQ